MKAHRMPHVQEGGVNVTPLIDVVMCLIIFFILVAKIGVSSGIDNKIDAPQTYLGVKITDMSNILVLNVYALAANDQPQVLVDLKGEKQKEIKIAMIADDKKTVLDTPLRKLLEALKKEKGEKFKVVVNGGKELEYRQLQLILQACAEAGVSEVSFVTKKATKVVQG